MATENHQPGRGTKRSTRRDSAGSEIATDQHARFLETARALGCDEDEAAFDEKLKGIAKPVPKAEKPSE